MEAFSFGNYRFPGRDNLYLKGILDIYPDECILLESGLLGIQIAMDRDGDRTVSVLNQRERVPFGYLTAISSGDLRTYRGLATASMYIFCKIFNKNFSGKVAIAAPDQQAAMEGTEIILPTLTTGKYALFPTIDYMVRANGFDPMQLGTLHQKIIQFSI